jgi:thiol-disulfide isomerase/thioredoxin
MFVPVRPRPSAPGLPRRLAVLLAVLAALWVPALAGAQETSPLIGKPAPLLSGRAAFGTGLLNLNRMQKDIVQERDAQGNPVREGDRVKLRVVKYAVVLNFFATYCVPCVQEIPTFNRVAKSYEGRPVKFVYVNVDTEKSAEEVRDFARQKGIEVEMMLPSVRYAVQAYKIDALPRIVVVDPEGVVTHVIMGFQADLAAQIGQILAQVLPAPPGRAPAKQAG